MNPGDRVSFPLVGKVAYGTLASVESCGRYLVAVDPQYMVNSQGELSVVAWIPAVSLTAVNP